MMQAEALKIYTLQLNDAGEIIGEVPNAPSREQAGRELVRKAEAYSSDHNLDFQTALRQVMRHPDNQVLVREYASGFKDGPALPIPHVGSQYADPSVVVVERAQEILDDGEAENFSAAVRRVLAEDDALRVAYANFRSSGGST